MTAASFTVIGVDGCRAGWVAVVLGPDGPPSAHLLAEIAAVTALTDQLAATAPVRVIGIDIPIGLPESGFRAADRLARGLLGPRRSSIFMTPPEPVLRAPDHASATARSVESTGAGISRQSYGLRARIFEVAAWLDRAPCRVCEVHPELSFTRMVGHPQPASKKTWRGVIERRAALRSAGIDVDAIAFEVGAAVPPDDVLDAAAVAWTAGRIACGDAVPVPDPPATAADGRPMAIWS